MIITDALTFVFEGITILIKYQKDNFFVNVNLSG